MRRTFRREAELLRSMRHPNIPMFFGYFADPNADIFEVPTRGIMMKLGTCRHISDRAINAKGLPPDIAHFFWCQLFAALWYLRPRCIVHLDIGDDALLWTRRGNLLLSGFTKWEKYDKEEEHLLSFTPAKGPHVPPEVRQYSKLSKLIADGSEADGQR